MLSNPDVFSLDAHGIQKKTQKHEIVKFATKGYNRLGYEIMDSAWSALVAE